MNINMIVMYCCICCVFYIEFSVVFKGYVVFMGLFWYLICLMSVKFRYSCLSKSTLSKA